MKRNSLYYLMLCALSTAPLHSIGCDLSSTPANQAPSEVSISSDKCYVAAGKTVSFSGNATDEDGDEITISWSATAGTFTTNPAIGATVTWRAPASYGPVEITMAVSDGYDTVIRKQTVTVCELLPLSITASRTIWNGGHPYITRDDLPIPVAGGVTLEIEPGVTIIIDRPSGGFDSYGRIVAEGTETDKIRLLPNSCAGEQAYWQGIYFNGAEAEGIFRFCEINGGKYGVHVRARARLDMRDCEIFKMGDFAVNAAANSQAALRGCFLWDNERGIYVENGAATILRCSIRYNVVDGIYCINDELHDSEQCSIDSCVVANNYRDGIVLADRAAPAIHYCSIFSNNEAGGAYYAIRLSANAAPEPIPAEQNYWGRGMDTEEKIAALIYDAHDNPEAISGLVSFIPWLDTAPVALAAARGAANQTWAK